MSLSSIWQHIKGFFSKVLDKAPTVINDALLAIAGVAPMLETVVDAADPALGVKLTPVLNLTVKDLQGLQKFVSDYEKAPGVGTLGIVHSAIAVIQTDLTDILQYSGVKNSAHAATITNIVNAVATDLSVLQSTLAAVMPAPPAAVA